MSEKCCAALRRFGGLCVLVVGAALLLAACGKHENPGMAAMMGGAAPVSVLAVQPEDIPLALEYAAQTLGVREAEVRARVTGILIKRNFVEGRRVQAGQSLFTIDPEPFAAAVASAEADVAAAAARSEQAARDAARLAPLIEVKAVSQKDYDDALSAKSISAADLLAAKAKLRQARLNLEWTRVEAPISGITSRAPKSEGSLISGPDILLTTVTQTDPMQVIFGVPDNDRLKLVQEIAAKRLQLPAGGRFKVTVKLADGTTYARSGYTDFSDVRISTDTGTSQGRAELPNPDGFLQPGQFVRVELSGATRIGAFRVPQRAVMEGPQGKFVYVVGKDNKAEVRPLELGEWKGGDVIVLKGLTAGERVIVDGVLKLGPGAPVQVAAPTAPAANPAAAPTGGPAQTAPKAGG
jgi:membrane fusion protein (multidrug efflux system)